MKLLLLTLCVCLTVATALVPRRSRNRDEFSKKDPELLKLASNKRVFRDDKVEMKSARMPRDLPKPKTASPQHADIEHKHFDTRLNHFDEADQRLVEFNYFLKDEYFLNGVGGILLYISDGGVVTTQLLETGLMHDIAIDTYSALATADLRYIRSNLPLENATFANLEFLTADQMVADIAILVQEIREELNAPDSNVILWGSGFGATLATWARREFPDLIQGVWSSSGIFLQELITEEPYERLSDVITEIGGAECASDVADAFVEFEYLLRTYEWFFVAESLDLCIFIWDYYDEEMAMASHGLIELIQNYFEVYHYNGVRDFCADIRSDSREEAFVNFARWVRHVFTDRTCLEFDYYQRIYHASHEPWEDVQRLSWEDVSLMYPFQSRPELYQRCTQLGNLPVTVNSESLFGRLIQQEFWFLYCSDAFYGENGDEYDYTLLNEHLTTLNERYGAQNPGITNAIYTNGELDPYFSFAITTSSEDDTHVFNIPNYFKSSDLSSISTFDSIILRDVKAEISEIIARWVSE